MRKYMILLVVLCSMLITSVAMAMTQEQLDEKRAYAEKRINQVEEVTYKQLLENEKHYYKKFVKVKGLCGLSNNGLALIGDEEATKVFSVQIMSYRFKVGTEYTVVGQFAGIMNTVEGDKWAVILEDTHLPYMSEYGL